MGNESVPVGLRVRLADCWVRKPVDLHLVLVLESGWVPLLYAALLNGGAALDTAEAAASPVADD